VQRSRSNADEAVAVATAEEGLEVLEISHRHFLTDLKLSKRTGWSC